MIEKLDRTKFRLRNQGKEPVGIDYLARVLAVIDDKLDELIEAHNNLESQMKQHYHPLDGQVAFVNDKPISANEDVKHV